MLLPQLVRCPEPRQGRAVRRLAQLFKSALSDLADALARHSHEGADLLERHGIGALFQAVVQMKDLSLAGREVLPENAVDELPHQVEVSHLFDLGTVDAGESFAQCAGFTIRAIDGCVK